MWQHRFKCCAESSKQVIICSDILEPFWPFQAPNFSFDLQSVHTLIEGDYLKVMGHCASLKAR